MRERDGRDGVVARARTALVVLMVPALALSVPGCSDDNDFVGDPDGARAFVTSDPVGGRILVDGRETGRTTPDTINGLLGRHDLMVRLDTLGASYSYSAQVTVAGPDTMVNVSGPLLLRCASDDCLGALAREFSVNRLKYLTNPGGTLFRGGANGLGLVWPATTNNRYAFAGMPMISARPYPDTIGLGIYDAEYLAGRPLPDIVEDEDLVRLRQSMWIVPPVDALSLATIRGIEVEETVLATADIDDVVVIRLVFRNITDDPLYRLVDPDVPEDSMTFPTAYVGFALDADIGATTDDDYISYDLDQDLAFSYDAAFEEPGFDGEHRDRPGLVGLRMLEAPPGATVVLNGWPRAGVSGATDWQAGTLNEGTGWGMMSGQRVYAPDHEDPRIGYMPPAPLDVRMMVSAGPVTLAPGDSVAITVAVVVAEPAAGTFTSGEMVEPGEPTDVSRPLYRIAQPLIERARAAEALLAQLPP